MLHRPLRERARARGLALIAEALDRGRSEVEPRECVGEPPRDRFPALEMPAERGHRSLRDERERRAQAAQALDMAAHHTLRCAREPTVRQTETERAERVAQREAEVAEERAVERVEIFVRDRVHLCERERVAADRTLTEYDHRAGEDVGALDRDRDRNREVR